MEKRIRKHAPTYKGFGGPQSAEVWVDTDGALKFNKQDDPNHVSAVMHTYRIPIVAATNAEQDTTFDLPAKAMVSDVIIDVTTAEVTGSSKTITVGTKAGESGGVAAGFLNGVSVASTGLKRGAVTVTSGVWASNTFGSLLSDFTAGTNSDDRGLFVRKSYLTDANTAKSIVWTPASAFTEFAGVIYIVLVEFTS